MQTNTALAYDIEQLETVQRLTKDINEASHLLSVPEIRCLVDNYYIFQEMRKRGANQVLALTDSEEPCAVIGWFDGQCHVLESQIKRALSAYSDADPLCAWAKSIVGIGPVISAGLRAHIDVTDPDTSVGQKWSFAGLNPTQKWAKGEKRPYNASLKTLAWKIGESFVKTKGHKDEFYGTKYDRRKMYEQAKNERGDYADQAAAILKKQKIVSKELKKTLESGQLCDAHLHSRVKRWVVKLFLSHYVEVAYALEHGKPLHHALPYAISRLDHPESDYIAPPNPPEWWTDPRSIGIK